MLAVLHAGIEEEEEMFHNAFHKAFDDSKPEDLKVAGLQEFAAAIWQRRSQIPSPSSKDPLLHIFDEVRQHCRGFYALTLDEERRRKNISLAAACLISSAAALTVSHFLTSLHYKQVHTLLNLSHGSLIRLVQIQQL